MSNRFWKLALAFGCYLQSRAKSGQWGKGTEHPQAKLPVKIAQQGKKKKKRAWDIAARHSKATAKHLSEFTVYGLPSAHSYLLQLSCSLCGRRMDLQVRQLAQLASSVRNLRTACNALCKKLLSKESNPY